MFLVKKPMASLVDDAAVPGLERSCGPATGDRIRIAPSCAGFERIEASFSGRAFEPHRHDTYAIGFTIHGVQSFSYRGAYERSLPGQVFVLHPDEIHDGHAGTTTGFRYRILYVEPSLIQDALGDVRRPLPFVRETVSDNRALAAAIMPALDDLDLPLEDLHRDQLVLKLADALASVDRSVPRRALSARHSSGVDSARDFLDANVGTAVTSADLEAVTGMTRYAVARHFRACLGTSPYRYLIMRRLDRVRALIRRGVPLVDAALSSGFADQSHMTRHFKKTYGMSPARWARIVAGGPTPSPGGMARSLAPPAEQLR